MRRNDVGHYLAAFRHETARVDALVENFTVRVQELLVRSGILRETLASLGVPGAILEELDLRSAELAFADASLHELSEMHARALRRLGYERARNDDLFDQAADAYVLTSQAGYIEDANAAAARLFSVQEGALRGKLLIAFVARQDTGAFRDWLRALEPSAEPQTLHVRLRPRGGTPLLAALAARRLPGPTDGGSALGWTIVPAPSVASAPLRDRMQAVIAELLSTLSAVRESSQGLKDNARRAGAHAETIEAVTRAAALPTMQLEKLQEIVQVAHLVDLTRNKPQ